MQFHKLIIIIIVFAGFLCSAVAQTGGTVNGNVTLKSKNVALHNVTVRIVQLGLTTDTGDDGSYQFTNVPPGTYDVVAIMPAMNGESEPVMVTAGGTATANFVLDLSAIRQEVTVTASGREELTLQAFQTVTSLDALQLAETPATSLGEALNNQPGVAKRSFGPGSSRPVIRGFDGDRILVLQDGASSGSLGSQSGDHTEPINTSMLERVEVLKGPATLLYGSNAIGGVVNAITAESDPHEHPHEGMQGFVSGILGSNNNQAGGSASFDYGVKNWRLFGSGAGQRVGNYSTSRGEVANSKAKVANGMFGIGRDSDRGFFSGVGGYDKGTYGIAGEESSIDFRRYNSRFNGGIRNLGGGLDTFRTTLSYTDWSHAELEGGEVGTELKNRQFTYRGVFEQKQGSILSGSFGFSGAFRKFEAIGEEALAPPTDEHSIAAFALEELRAEKVRFQLGGRIENVRYHPDGATHRSFSGLSGGVGVHIPLWANGAFVANFTGSYRAPALEELYNNGPHPGNLAFEVGNDALKRERSNGIDLSLRHQDSRIRAESNFFYYDIRDFVYLAPTGRLQDGFDVFNYSQDNTRFFGTEQVLDVALHPSFWLNLGLDSVNAKLKATDTPLPRIPPLRGHVGFDLRYQGLSVRPEVLMANAQNNTFTNETSTAGYSVFNLKGSYTIARQHDLHVIALNAFNLGNRLYFNHVSFVKDAAPEIGRGINVTYTVRFF